MQKSRTDRQTMNMGRKLKLLIAALASILLVLTSVPAANATYFSGGMYTTKFSVRYVGANSTMSSLFDQSRGNWNSAGVGAGISKNLSSAHAMRAGSYTNEWYGLYSSTGNRALKTTKFNVYVNTRTLYRDMPNKVSTTWYLSTGTHELGHALSLADNPSTSSASLMKHSRNRSTIYKPQTYDKNEVKRIY